MRVYAKWQHEGLDFHHPRGGQALYLHEPLMSHYGVYLDAYAKAVLVNGGQDVVKVAVEDLAAEVAVKAPVEFGNLRASAHPSVTSDGEVIYDRAPLQHRMSEQELRAERGIFGPEDINKEHEAIWLHFHPGQVGAHTPQSKARMDRWVFEHGIG